MQEKSIIAKIKALMSKTIESGATEAEALAAMEKAHELLQKYQLNMSELDIKAEGTAEIAVAMDKRRYSTYLSPFVAKYCGCKSWTSPQNHTHNFIGLASDAQFAQWLLESLVGFVQYQQMLFVVEQASASWHEGEDFAIGIIHRIKERLKEQIACKTQSDIAGAANALVVVKNSMVNDAYAKRARELNLQPGVSSRSTQRYSSAFQEGLRKGDLAGLNRPIGSGTKLAITRS